MIRWGVNTVEQDKKWRENGGTGQEVEGKRRNMIRCGGKTEKYFMRPTVQFLTIRYES